MRAMELVTVHNGRANVLVTARVMVEDGGEQAAERHEALQAIVRSLVDRNITEDLKALQEAVKGTGVALAFGTVGHTVKDLQLNDTKGLHRLARDVAGYLRDLREKRLIPGQGEPGPLPGIDTTVVTSVRVKALPVPDHQVGSVDVEVAL